MLDYESTKEHKIRLYDEDIREPLFEYLEEHFGKTRMFEEKIIGRSRADIVMLTEECIIGLEIKSDADSYERLKRQVKNYNRFCDKNYVVVGKTHEKHISKHVPEFWGIMVVSVEHKDIVVTENRGAMENPKMKKESQITMLWRPELQHILEQNHLPKYKQRSKKFVQQKLMEKMDWNQLKFQMCQEMFERDYTLWEENVREWEKSKERTCDDISII